MKSVNPATGDLLREIPETKASAISEAFQKARLAQSSWVKTSLESRLACLEKFQQALRREQESLARDLTAEVGKPLQEARNEVEGAAAKLDFFLNHSVELLTPREVFQSGKTREILAYDPLGVVGVISAWNYPFLVGINHYVPALIAGNAVLYKPSEWASISGQNITRLLVDSGVPPELFTCIIGSAAAGQQLLELPLDGYFFTGSQDTGIKIASQVAARLVPLGLELGGKDPLYVTEDVDLDRAVADAVDGIFYNNGQSCCSVERLYLHQAIHDAFLPAFLDKVRSLKVGDPLDPETTQGPLTRPGQLAVLEDQVWDAREKGAHLECGGKRLQGPGFYFPPTILTRTNHRMKVMREESFGPIIGIMKVTDDAEAIRWMDDTEYGLTAAVFTRDLDRGRAILKHLQTGTGYLNCCDRVSGYSPWSGRRHSGLGTTLSQHGLFAFVNPRAFQLRE